MLLFIFWATSPTYFTYLNQFYLFWIKLKLFYFSYFYLKNVTRFFVLFCFFAIFVKKPFYLCQPLLKNSHILTSRKKKKIWQRFRGMVFRSKLSISLLILVNARMDMFLGKGASSHTQKNFSRYFVLKFFVMFTLISREMWNHHTFKRQKFKSYTCYFFPPKPNTWCRCTRQTI